MGIRGRKIWYGAGNFFDTQFIRGGQLLYTGQTTFWTLLLHGAKNFFDSKFSEVIRGRLLFGPSFYTGQRTFFTQNGPRWYGAGNFLNPRLIRGKELFSLRMFQGDTGRANFFVMASLVMASTIMSSTIMTSTVMASLVMAYFHFYMITKKRN